jgi:hypothetical protein
MNRAREEVRLNCLLTSCYPLCSRDGARRKSGGGLWRSKTKRPAKNPQAATILKGLTLERS